MNVKDFYDGLDRIFAAKRMSEAEGYMIEALKESEKRDEMLKESERGDDSVQGADLDVAVAACNELGGLYRVTSRYDEAFPYYEKALEYIDKMGQKGSEGHGVTVLNYATTLDASGKTNDALKMYEKAADILRKCGGDVRFQAATVRNNISSIYHRKGDYKTAIEQLKEALEILEELSDSEIEKAITYCNLAGIYVEMNSADEAWMWAERAVKGFEDSGGEDDVHYPAALCALGNAAYFKGEYEQALEAFTKAAELTERDFGRDTDAYRTISENMRICQGKIDEI